MTARPIAFLIRSLDVGGAQRQLVELARGLRAAGRDVIVVTYYGGGQLEPELHGAGVRHVIVGKRGRWDVVGFAARLVRALHAQRPGVVHGYLPDANVMLSTLRPLLGGARVVWGVRASRVDFSRYGAVARGLFAVSRQASRLADLIICNSRDGAEYHVSQGYPAHRVRVVPNGIDTERFRPDPAARLRQRATWGVAADEPVVGLVGRLDPMKDHATAVRAAAALVAREPRLRLVFVGEGPAAYVDEVRALASSLGVGSLVTWAPATRDVAAVYNGFDVLALCSAFGEGFPNAVGEAMGCGIPCAVTDVGDAAWVVGDTGFVAPVGDAAAVARSWAAALDARRADPALGARCRARIVTEFSVPALVRRTLAALDGAMEAA